MMLLKQIAATPTPRRSPNWRSIGTFAKCNAAKAKMSVEGDDEERRAEVGGGLLDRMRRSGDDHLLLDPGVHLDRVVDARFRASPAGRRSSRS